MLQRQGSGRALGPEGEVGEPGGVAGFMCCFVIFVFSFSLFLIYIYIYIDLLYIYIYSILCIYIYIYIYIYKEVNIIIKQHVRVSGSVVCGF